MRRMFWIVTLVGCACLAAPRLAPAQVFANPGLEGASVQEPLPSSQYDGPNSVFGAPGNFGVMYGTASFGMPRTYTAFASSYGAGYGYGYAPYAYMPGRYGAGLWNPSSGSSGTIPSVGYYRTFPVPPRPNVTSPPIGLYAPGFGPPWTYGQ